MKALNDLPNLEELHCRYVFGTHAENTDVEPHNTIVGLYNQDPLGRCYKCKSGIHPDPNCINAPKKMAKYVRLCKKYFRGLQLFSIENPPIVRHFRPEMDDYDLP